jgi:uncharacterized membrane protein YfcA
MQLEIYQIILLLVIGGLVGISMSFVGQTGQGFVIPLVLLLTEDVLLAIAVSVLNDLIAAGSVSIGYLRKKQLKFRKDIFILLVISWASSILAVIIMLTTPLGSIFGIVLPLFFLVLGFGILRKGFPTSESLINTVNKLSERFSKDKKEGTKNIEKSQDIEENSNTIELSTDDEFKSIIDPNSRLFYLIAIIMGVYVGINSGLFGANSGFILALVLILLYGYPIKKGVGTALILSIFVCIWTFTFYQILGFTYNGKFYYDWSLTLFLGIGSFISGIIFSNYVQNLSAKAMGRGMGTIIMVLGVVSLIFYIISQTT